MSRARVFKIKKTWYCEVYSGKRLIVADNTGSWASMMACANQAVGAVRLVERWGNKLKYDWYECMDRAPSL